MGFRFPSLCLFLVAVAIGPGLCGCAGESVTGAVPPQGAFYFPAAVQTLPIDPAVATSRFALVANTNFDTRFKVGWLSVVDVDALLTASAPVEGVVQQLDNVPADAVVQQLNLPSFAGPIAIDTSTEFAEGETRLAFMGHRGSYLLSIVEVTVQDGVPRISCGDAAATTALNSMERQTDCDRRHLYSLQDNANLAGFDVSVSTDNLIDPYAVAIYSDPVSSELKLAVSFLSHNATDTTRLLVFRVQTHPGPNEPFLVPEHVVGLGQAGVSSIAVRPSDCAQLGDCATYLAATSHLFGGLSETSAIFAVTFSVDGTIRETTHGVAADIGGGEVGDLVFTPDGQSAFATNNGPDSLVAIDSSQHSQQVLGGATGATYVVEPSYGLIDALPLAGRPSALVYFTGQVDGIERDFVATTGFTGNELDFVSVTGGALFSVAQLRDVGSGPFGLAQLADAAGDLLLVSTFYDHGVTVVRVPANNAAAATTITHVRSAEFGNASTE